jgi:alkylation response protein AidB-like acyl-CoA dehydrogenase
MDPSSPLDLRPSAAGLARRGAVRAFIDEHILPVEAELLRRQRALPDPWVELPEVAALKARARAEGLWNLFLPEVSGLSVLDYAGLAEEMGRSLYAPEVFNCNAPDTGNMEVLERFGSPAQKARWLGPLLEGELRSAFLMTEPAVASSDATNMQATARIDGDEVVLDGTKWWSTGVGHPRCGLLLFMGLTDPDGPRHARHSIVLVPRDAPGVHVQRMLRVFGDEDPPYGHGEVQLRGVRLPVDHIVGGPGMGFLIAQGRLGPGRIHHCMRLIGAAERALGLMVARGSQRVAFGKPLINLDGNRQKVAQARIDLEMARLLTLKAARMIDTVGVMEAMVEISAIKVVAPRLACRIIDEAIQLHGGAGVSDDLPLAAMYANARILRLADGPDEVHLGLIAREELKRQARGSAR